MAETRFVLIRHGEAQCHVEQRVGGPEGCTGLSDLGRRQAEALRTRLEQTGELDDADVLYASTLPRAVETAEIISGAVGRGRVSVQQEQDLSELRPGEADGMAWEVFREKYMPEPYAWDAYKPMAPGAESWAEFMLRVGTALDALATEHAGKKIVISCHGGVIEGAWVALGQLAIVSRFEHDIDNTSISEWVLRNDRGGRERWALVRFNDRAHLASVQ